MRVISGTAGGITLQVPQGEVRPTTDRVREALFSIINSRVKGAKVLDLFAGSGALGLEALSRGATYVTFVDGARRSCEAIKQNMRKTHLSSAIVHQNDAVEFVKRDVAMQKKYDIIFADPPYCKALGDKDFIMELVENNLPHILSAGGLFIAEAEEGWGVARGTKSTEVNLPGLEFLSRRCYGKNTLLIFTTKDS